MKQCSKCKEKKKESEFYRREEGRLRSQCKECYKGSRTILESNRRYYHKHKHDKEFRDRKNKQKKREYEKNKDKYRARKKAREKIKMEGMCEKCNKRKAEHRHHPDYFKPLEVIKLCQPCHKEVHTGISDSGSDFILSDKVGKYGAYEGKDVAEAVKTVQKESHIWQNGNEEWLMTIDRDKFNKIFGEFK